LALKFAVCTAGRVNKYEKPHDTADTPFENFRPNVNTICIIELMRSN
jgi:hypothetical protein